MRVKGEGPIPSRLLLCGEGPGKHESLTGRPFVETAPAGAELTRYLNGYTLPTREAIYLTNLVKEWAEGTLVKVGDDLAPDVLRDQWELQMELLTVRPRIVGTLGRWATRWFLGDVQMEAAHGLLFRTGLCPQCGTVGTLCPCDDLALPLYVIPIYHPAAGLHQPELAARTAYDLAQLAAILKAPEVEWPARCWRPAPLGTYEEGSIAASAPEQGIDTEGVVGALWGLSVSTMPGWAGVLRKGVDYGFTSDDGGTPPPLLCPRNLPDTTWIFHNYCWDAQVLAAEGIAVDEDHFHDTMVMAYLLGVEPQSLKDLAFRHLGRVRKSYEEVVGQWVTGTTKTGKPKKKPTRILRSLDQIPLKEAIDYAGGDADDTLSLKPILWKKIEDLGLTQVYEIDRRVLPLYARMERNGLPIDLGHYADFGDYLTAEILVRTLALQDQYGPDFNPASADQVAEVLFGTLALPGGKRTPSGKRFATDDDYLEAIRDLHPTVPAIQELRELQKLKGTFVGKLARFVKSGPHGDPRLGFRLLPTRVVSGRLAAKDPNVLALPKHTPLGKRFRAGVRAPEGHLLGSWDFSQIELRVLALDSGSSTLQDLYRSGADLHARTAQKIFGVPPELQDPSLHRLPSKTCNFQIIMGTTRVGLASRMRAEGYPFPELHGIPFDSLQARRDAEEEVCDAWIKTVIADWEIGSFIAEAHAEARRVGCVRDRWGRIRWLPSVLSPHPRIREEALRQAQAFKPQGGARGFVKIWEARVWREVIKPLQAEGAWIEPLLDLHDDLLLEFQEDLGDLLKPLLEQLALDTFADLPIPMPCKGTIGARWSDL